MKKKNVFVVIVGKCMFRTQRVKEVLKSEIRVQHGEKHADLKCSKKITENQRILTFQNSRHFIV